jgi:hypothetical protein
VELAKDTASAAEEKVIEVDRFGCSVGRRKVRFRCNAAETSGEHRKNGRGKVEGSQRTDRNEGRQ